MVTEQGIDLLVKQNDLRSHLIAMFCDCLLFVLALWWYLVLLNFQAIQCQVLGNNSVLGVDPISSYGVVLK